MIYFMQPIEGGPIKIGTTIRLSQRLKALAAEFGTELRVLAVLDGSYAKEKELHRRFAHLRVVNELFEPGDDLVGFIVAEGRLWDGSDEVPLSALGTPVRLTDDAIKWARIASGYTGESMAEYVSRITVERGKEDADRLHAEVSEKPGKAKPGKS